ncbi:MAG: AAA family ATPase, partial [Methanotrichaceae archaeon]|nr:AAA family ATPase [Methanotrichaceae archaeon]
PILPLHQITVLFGEGGSLKSYFALVLSLIAKGCLWPNPAGLGLQPPAPANSGETLWLDYETDPDTFRYRLTRICNGHSLDKEKIRLRYLRCSIPLVDDLDRLAKEVRDKNIGLIVVDSMGMGAGGDINTQAVSTSFFMALRSLGRTALVITHEAKEQMIAKMFIRPKKTPFGSAYVTNEARSVWRVEKKQEAAQPEAYILLTHLKANDSPYSRALSYKVMFGDQATTFELSDACKIPEFEAKTVPLKQRIVNYLGEHGQSTFSELELLEPDTKVLAARLRELVRDGEIQELKGGHLRADKQYRLLYKELPFT